MNWIYQIKNNVRENTIYITGLIGTLYLILTCNYIFWKKTSDLNMDMTTMSEIDDILSNITDISDISDDDFEIVSEYDDIDMD